MKKTPVWIIIVWIVLALAAIAWIILSNVFTFHPALAWSIGSLLIVGLVVWIVLHFTLGRPKHVKKGAAFVGNQAVYRRIEHETQEATARYLGAVKRSGMLKKSALYERPWFLLLGPRKSGKTSLLRGSGLNFPLRYPSEKDGFQVEGANQVSWYFANEAVWIDTPGSYAEDSSKDEWQALVASLQNVRPERPLDGVAIVVSAHEVLNADPQAVKDLARSLRARIDEVIACWGIEFPVYLIFNSTDKVPGFTEYFGEQFIRAQDQIFGATISQEQQKLMPRVVFADEFRLLIKSLTDLRLDKLHKEPNANSKRQICRFVIHFEGIQEKLGQLVTELFKPTNYVGKPIFRGFYFTSSYESTPKSASEPSVTSTSTSISATIANHPLNPKRILSDSAKQVASKPGASTAKDITSIFVLPLFREIMVEDKTLVGATQKRSRQSLVKHLIFSGLMVLAAGLIITLMMISRNRSAELLSAASKDIEILSSKPSSLNEYYGTLEVLSRTIARLQKYERRGTLVDLGFGFYKGDRILAELKKYYFASLKRFILSPAVKYLEYSIRNSTGSYEELSGEAYDSLYSNLKAYLSVSEAMSERFSSIDTSFLRPVLQEAVTQSILSNLQTARLPENLETIVIDNVGNYLFYLKRKEYPLIQENQELVNDARSKLRRLPDAANLYAAVVNRISSEAPQISLDQMLGRTGEGILKSPQTISSLYTQDGWDQLVSEAITEASKDPYKIDWVIGITKDQVPEQLLDTRQLRSDMVDVYIQDFRKQWLDFLTSIQIDPFGDLSRSSRMLQKLASDQSELKLLLETVANYTVLKQETKADQLADKAMGLASKSKEAKQLNKLSKATGVNAPQFSLGQKTPFDELNATFDPLRSFVRSTGGGLSGYEGYKDKVMSLVEQLTAIETQGKDYAVVVFNASDKDPLLAGWKYTTSSLESMPTELADALRGVLLVPFQHAGSAASEVLTTTLNLRWQNEIVKPFTSRFSGRYPFDKRGQDATFNDVMEFFRPSTGTFWGFYDRVLSPFVVKTSSGWSVRTVGSLALNFNPKLQDALVNGERIRDIFFKPNGEILPISILFSPSSSNKNSAKLEVNGQVLELAPGGKSLEVRWPIESPTQSASLKINVQGGFTQDVSFGGQWGFLKLIQAAKVNPVNKNTLNITWQASVQNMYMVYQQYRLQVSGADNPFADPVFSNFNCPTELMIKDVKPQAQASGQ